jgi:hypothetical protein
LHNNVSGAVLTGKLSVGAIAGYALFDDLRINLPGEGYTLRFYASGLLEVIHAPFAVGGPIGPAAPVQIVTQTLPPAVITVQPSPVFGQRGEYPTAPLPTGQVGVPIISNTPPGYYAGALPSLPSPDYPAGSSIVIGSTQYYNRANVWIPTMQVPGVSDLGTRVVDLPQLPNVGYAAGSIVFNQKDNRWYFNRFESWELMSPQPGVPPLRANPPVGTPLGVPVRLLIIQQPVGPTKTGLPIPAIRVQGIDAFGNVVSNWTGVVSVRLENNVTGAILGGTTSVGAAAGTAAFGNLSVNLVGTSYTLRFSASGLQDAISLPFDIV